MYIIQNICSYVNNQTFHLIIHLNYFKITGKIVVMDSLHTYKINRTPGGAAEQIAAGSWRLSIPPTRAACYQLSQLDDYSDRSRGRFNWQAPLRLECSARVSHPNHAGTWGFGFWNDPFAASLWIKGAGMRLPTLPNVAWFMYASPESQLSLQISKQANGLLAAIYQSPLIPRRHLSRDTCSCRWRSFPLWFESWKKPPRELYATSSKL